MVARKEQGIFDAHSHLGLNILHLGDSESIQYFDCPSQEYVENAERLGVTHSAVSYAPCPEYTDARGITVRPCFWLYENGKVSFYREEVDPTTAEVRRVTSQPNPYHEANYKLLDELQSLNRASIINFYALGLVHPLLDTEDEIYSLIANESVVGFKLHGLATHTGPKDVPSFVPEALREYNKPIVVHTDLMRDPTGYRVMHDLYNANHPGLWLDWAIENDVKIFLTHGARLDQGTIQKASRHQEKTLVGTSPDLLLESEPFKLAVETSHFLQTLIKLCPHSLLAFDIDFSWNVVDRTVWNEKDWDMIERHRDLIPDPSELNQVLYDNARRFYGR